MVRLIERRHENEKNIQANETLIRRRFWAIRRCFARHSKLAARSALRAMMHIQTSDSIVYLKTMLIESESDVGSMTPDETITER